MPRTRRGHRGPTHDAAVHAVLDRVSSGDLSRLELANEGGLIRARARSPLTHEPPMGLGSNLADASRDLLRAFTEAVHNAPTREPGGRPLLRVLPGGKGVDSRRPDPTPPAAG